MPTLTTGQSASFIVGIGESYTVSLISGEAYVDGQHERESSTRLTPDSQMEAVCSDFLSPRRITVRSISGSVNYQKAGQIETAHTLTASDDGKILECTNAATITVPAGLPAGFAVVIAPSGTTSVAFVGTTGNASATTITRASASNAMFAVQQRTTNTNAYLVTGV